MSSGLLHDHVTRQKTHSNKLPEIVTIAIARNRRKYIKTVTFHKRRGKSWEQRQIKEIKIMHTLSKACTNKTYNYTYICL